jgi:predicted nucleic acid-binding protein
MFPQMDKNGQERNCIVAKIFIDTNIFIYTLDKYDKTKQKTARATVKNIMKKPNAI